MRILGLDPGLRLTGYGCIEVAEGDSLLGTVGAINFDCHIIEAGVFRLGVPPARRSARSEGGSDQALVVDRSAASVSSRLVELERDLTDALERLKPRVVAVESLFAHYKHPATAIIMGHARGVMLLAIRKAGIELREYKPNEVKKALTGHGHAEKGQMQRAIAARFGLSEPPRPPDVADALAIALCAASRQDAAGAGGSIPRRTTGRSKRAAEKALLARGLGDGA